MTPDEEEFAADILEAAEAAADDGVGALDAMLGWNVFLLGVSLGMAAMLTGDEQAVLLLISALLGAERADLRIRKKVLIELRREPTTAVLGVVFGAGVVWAVTSGVF